jgi:tetratricopeptide (TPR) repeat protein
VGGHRDEAAPVLVRGAADRPEPGTLLAAPMVGRKAELALLLACLEEARDGHSRTVLVTGEVGIGKSRLVHAFRETAGVAGTDWVECQCSPYFQRTPFHPLVALVRKIIQQAIGHASGGAPGPADVAEAVQSLALDASLTPAIELLLSLPVSNRTAVEQLSPQLRRERTIDALVSLLHRRAATAPAVFVVEDLHWADPSTLEFLDRLSVLENAPLLTLLTARPDFTPAWNSPSAITPVQLRRLPPAETARLIAQVSGRDVPAEVVEQLVRQTDGIPLFIEELTRLLLGTPGGGGGKTLDAVMTGEVPTTLREALNARLDRLGAARGLAQLGAVLGQEFEEEDLRALWSGDSAGFKAQLRELVRAKVLHPRGLPPHLSYAFQHTLLRDAAHDSLPSQIRRSAHGRIARDLANRSKGPAARPEWLAYHFAEAGMVREAVPLLLQAGQAALASSANAEARGHFQRGIDLLGKLEQTPADVRLEITLRTLEGMTWVVSRGYAVAEVEEAFGAAMQKVRALAQEETPDLLPALWAQWLFVLVRGSFREALEHSARLLRLADRFRDPGAAMLAHLAQGTTFHGLGRFEEAVVHLDEGIGRYDPAAHSAYRYIYGQDPLMFGSVFKAWALWCLGFPDRAATLVNQTVAHAESLRHPNSLGFALAISAIVHQYRGEVEALAQVSKALLELSTEQGWIHWLGHARLWAGAGALLEGHLERGIVALREARQFAEQAGERSGAGHYDAVLIDALCRAGLLEEARERIQKAKERLAAGGEQAFEADLLRLEGEVVRQGGDLDGARRLFREARESARSRKSRSYELRAALSLARLEREEGRRGEARADLARVFGEFTEGFDTADLRAARAELDAEAFGSPPGASGGP